MLRHDIAIALTILGTQAQNTHHRVKRLSFGAADRVVPTVAEKIAAPPHVRVLSRRSACPIAWRGRATSKKFSPRLKANAAESCIFKLQPPSAPLHRRSKPSPPIAIARAKVRTCDPYLVEAQYQLRQRLGRLTTSGTKLKVRPIFLRLVREGRTNLFEE
eukprot:1178211-Prorocentrum_minimum.AAC.6